MLSKEKNELLTRVGPGTPMGALMRRYWIPALLSSELPKENCDPIRIQLLGEAFVAWRDAKGRVGIFDEHCPHRGMCLALGRGEGDGLRCLYHGWKFATDGEILETPNEPLATIRSKVRATVFPSAEAGDIVWVYIGPKGKQPEFPNYGFMNVEPPHRFAWRTVIHANWLQSMEGHLDSSHAGILHEDWDPFGKKIDKEFEAVIRATGGIFTQDDAPTIEVEDTVYGMHVAGIRNAELDAKPVRYARVHSFSLPWMCIIPPRIHSFEVPIDDEHTSVMLVTSNPAAPIDRDGVEKLQGPASFYAPRAPYAPWVFNGDAANRWHQDRESMRRGSFSGINGFVAEDYATVVSMGPIFDRSKEHLVRADAGIIRMRQLLLDAVINLQKGIEPPMLSAEEQLRTQAGEGVLKPDQKWQELVPGNRPASRKKTRAVSA